MRILQRLALNVCHTFSVTPPCYPKQNEGYLRMRKILIQINFYFVIKIWQMRNVSTQNREKLFFPFLLYFSPTITQSFIMRFTSMPNVVQDGECVCPVKFLCQTDKKKNARSKVTFLLRALYRVTRCKRERKRENAVN